MNPAPMTRSTEAEQTRRDTLDRLLDEALAETFPASDPIALERPATRPDGDRDDRAPGQDVIPR